MRWNSGNFRKLRAQSSDLLRLGRVSDFSRNSFSRGGNTRGTFTGFTYTYGPSFSLSLFTYLPPLFYTRMPRSTGKRPGGSSTAKSSNNTATAAPKHNPHAPPAPAPPTMAAPMHAPVPHSQPGFLARVAETAAGVAIGHAAGRAITGLFSGDSSASQAASPSEPMMTQSSSNGKSALCDPHVQSFMKCMDEHHQDLSACQIYMDMLKSCRGEATSSYSSY